MNPRPPEASRTALQFQPDEFQLSQMHLFRQNSTPRYLFRTYSPHTTGSTTTTFIKPPASSCHDEDKTCDIFRLKPRDAATRLNEHLRWWRAHEPDCNLMSWTSSLLFALRYGFYRHCLPGKESDLNQVFLLGIDTKEFPEGTFVKDLDIMKVFARHLGPNKKKNLQNLLDLRTDPKGYYFGEYLTQGDLTVHGTCVETSMQSLIDAGLFDILPQLGNTERWNQWVKHVRNLRFAFQPTVLRPFARTSEVRNAITIAETCFGDHWVIPMAAMLLALKPRRNQDSVIVTTFQAKFTTEEIESSLSKLKIDASGLPEVEQFQSIVNSLSRQMASDDIDDLVEAMPSLELSDHSTS